MGRTEKGERKGEMKGEDGGRLRRELQSIEVERNSI